MCPYFTCTSNLHFGLTASCRTLNWFCRQVVSLNDPESSAILSWIFTVTLKKTDYAIIQSYYSLNRIIYRNLLNPPGLCTIFHYMHMLAFLHLTTHDATGAQSLNL